jgi:hypothetical protein
VRKTALLLLFLAGAGCSREPSVADLQAKVEKERVDKMRTYQPKVNGMIGDLNAPAADILRQLPGVSVEQLVKIERPTHRIIHIRDWHYETREVFALEHKNSDDAYQRFLLQVELVQLANEAVLRRLLRYHGLRRVLAEGVTPQGLDGYQGTIVSLKEMDRSIAALQERAVASGKRSGKLHRGIELLLKEHRGRLVQYGASGRVAIDGDLQVLPLDDGLLLQQAKPGAGGVDSEKLAARNDGQVKAAIAAGPVAVIELGGSHDLSESVRRVGGGQVEYYRLTTGRYVEVADE